MIGGTVIAGLGASPMEVYKTERGLVIEVDWDEANLMTGAVFRANMDARDAAAAHELRSGRLSSQAEADLLGAMFWKLEKALPDDGA